jgi:hypothetical protein
MMQRCRIPLIPLPGSVIFGLLWLLLWPAGSRAQDGMTGLGPFRFGRTTPDSLDRTAFRADPQPLVKGTIALTCDHIRLVRAPAVTTAGATLRNVVLAFYDDKLMAISCTYTDSLNAWFQRQYGPGVGQPERRVLLCTTQPDKPTWLRGRVWKNGDVRGIAVTAAGYTPGGRLHTRLPACHQRPADNGGPAAGGSGFRM